MTNELLISGTCGSCRKAVRLRVPSPTAGQEVHLKCPECLTPIHHTVSKKDMAEYREQQIAISRTRAEMVQEARRVKAVKEKLDWHARQLDPYCQRIHDQTGRWPGSFA